MGNNPSFDFSELRNEFKESSVLARFTIPVIQVFHEERTDTFYLADRHGNIFTYEEFKKLAAEIEEFHKIFSDQDITKSNDFRRRRNDSNGQEQINGRKHFENREEILNRANNQCEFCNSGEKLHVHHKDFEKSNNAPENAQVLCQKCHSKLHKEREARLRRELQDKCMAEIRKRDLEVEQEIRAAWVKQRRSLDEIGGKEFNEFFHNYTR